MDTAETPQSTNIAFTPSLADTERQNAGGEGALALTMSLDGFVAGRTMQWTG